MSTSDRGHAPAEPPPAPFLVTAAGAPGLSPAQVRHPRFVAPSRGVRVAADAADLPAELVAAALLVAPADATLCDLSAARFWGLPLPPWLGFPAEDVPVAVARPAGAHRQRQRRRGVRGRRLRLPPTHVERRGSLLVTTPARTWLDCAQFLPIDHLVAMGDVVLRHRLASPGELESMVRWGRGRRGVTGARHALPLLDPGAESPPESRVRCHLVLAGIPRPFCNMDIVVQGEWLARADLAWPDHRVIVEYDGAVHLSERQRRSDAARRNLLQDAGWLVIVFTASDLRRPWSMATLVRSALDSRPIAS